MSLGRAAPERFFEDCRSALGARTCHIDPERLTLVQSPIPVTRSKRSSRLDSPGSLLVGRPESPWRETPPLRLRSLCRSPLEAMSAGRASSLTRQLLWRCRSWPFEHCDRPTGSDRGLICEVARSDLQARSQRKLDPVRPPPNTPSQRPVGACCQLASEPGFFRRSGGRIDTMARRGRSACLRRDRTESGPCQRLGDGKPLRCSQLWSRSIQQSQWFPHDEISGKMDWAINERTRLGMPAEGCMAPEGFRPLGDVSTSYERDRRR